MRIVNKSIVISVTIFVSSILCLNNGHGAEKVSILNHDWHLTINSFQDGLTKIPVWGGKNYISARELKGGGVEEGVVIKGEINPTAANTSREINLKDFKLVVGTEEFYPFFAEMESKKKNTVEQVGWPGGYSSILVDKGDFPAAISIMYLVKPNQKKVLIFGGSAPVTLSPTK